jgi:dienelactone hydrolase
MRWIPVLVMLIAVGSLRAENSLEKGTVVFKPTGDQKEVPERYRLAERSFAWEMDLKYRLPDTGVTISRVRFPSAVESPHKENNTVHAEYYRPDGPGPFPAVIVLDITGGDQTLSRMISTSLAQNKVAGLFVQMAYYGPRRPPGSSARLLSPNIPQTLAAVRQTVLDLRLAAAWLEARPEVDGKRLGIMGTSLGSFVAALAGEMEPRLKRVVVLLGGGGFVDAFWDDVRVKPLRQTYELFGGKKEKIAKMIEPVDPLTWAANLKTKQLLIMAAARDDIVPPQMAKWLWEASGKQKIVWFDSTHYGAALYFFSALNHTIEHFKAD